MSAKKLVAMILYSCFCACGDDNPCPDRQAEITPDVVWKCTTSDIESSSVGLGSACNPQYEFHGDCCYGLQCSQDGTCQLSNVEGRLNAPCKSTGDCMRSLRCNYESKCVEDTADWQCLREHLG